MLPAVGSRVACFVPFFFGCIGLGMAVCTEAGAEGWVLGSRPGALRVDLIAAAWPSPSQVGMPSQCHGFMEEGRNPGCGTVTCRNIIYIFFIYVPVLVWQEEEAQRH